MTKPTRPKPLRNRYYGFRHGQSESNVQDISQSDPTLGVTQYGVTEAGRAQVRATVRANRALLKRAVLYSSDFLRTKQTAEQVAKELDRSEPIVFDRRLRERGFGTFSGKPVTAYVQARTAVPGVTETTEGGVETIEHLSARTAELIEEIEKQYTDRDVVLVAHGDPLQVTEARLQGDALANHRSHGFENGELRLLNPNDGKHV